MSSPRVTDEAAKPQSQLTNSDTKAKEEKTTDQTIEKVILTSEDLSTLWHSTKLGTGTYARVVLICVDREKLAVKIFERNHKQSKRCKQIAENEVEKHSALSECPYVTTLIKVSFNLGVSCLYFKAEKFTLSNLMYSWSNRVAFNNALYVIADIANALIALGKKKIVHRDIKPENILVSGLGPNGRAVLADLGFAIYEGENGPIGTYAYSAPEAAYLTCTPETSADMFSLGVVITELFYVDKEKITEDSVFYSKILPPGNDEEICRRAAFQGKIQEKVDNLLGGLISARDLYDSRHQNVLKLARKCLSFHAQERPTAEKFLETMKGLVEDVKTRKELPPNIKRSFFAPKTVPALTSTSGAPDEVAKDLATLSLASSKSLKST